MPYVAIDSKSNYKRDILKVQNGTPTSLQRSETTSPSIPIVRMVSSKVPWGPLRNTFIFAPLIPLGGCPRDNSWEAK